VGVVVDPADPVQARSIASTESTEPTELLADGVPVGRRVFLGLLGLAGLGVVFGPRAQDRLATAARPFADLLPSAGRFRIYSVVGALPKRSPADYRLRVDGLVDRTVDLIYDQLTSMTPTSITRDFQCVTGWRVADVAWTGVPLHDVLALAGVQPTAKALVFHSFDGLYTESLTLDQAMRDDMLCAYAMDGGPVSSAHGGPVRLYAAPMYGYKSLKWLERIEVVDRVVPGYWEDRGYDVDAWVGRSNGRDDAPTS
jgi:DMSO/TMAO reductase YedYZ molybdopterin-dependent catalytic subunit